MLHFQNSKVTVLDLSYCQYILKCWIEFKKKFFKAPEAAEVVKNSEVIIRQRSQLRQVNLAFKDNVVLKAFASVKSMTERLRRGAEVLIN